MKIGQKIILIDSKGEESMWKVLKIIYIRNFKDQFLKNFIKRLYKNSKYYCYLEGINGSIIMYESEINKHIKRKD